MDEWRPGRAWCLAVDERPAWGRPRSPWRGKAPRCYAARPVTWRGGRAASPPPGRRGRNCRIFPAR